MGTVVARLENFGTIRRRRARSGRLSYSEPVTLYESRDSRIVLVPLYIPHDSREDELSLKIVTYRKGSLGLTVNEERCTNLPPSAVRELIKHLGRYIAIARESDDGDYLLLKIREGIADLNGHDPAAIANALANVLSQSNIVGHLQHAELSSQLINALKSVIRLNEMRSAVAELQERLNQGEADEAVYQRWCEEHTWAFGNAYVMRDDVREITPGDHLDIVLSGVIAGYRDIVELKRPDMEVLCYDSGHKNYYFASDLSKAIGQCHRYLDVLHEVAAHGLRDHPEIVAYHPRATIVIGRSKDWSLAKLRALHGLNRRLSGINVMTYDHLLLQGERLVQLFSEQTLLDDELTEFHENTGEWDDNIPF